MKLFIILILFICILLNFLYYKNERFYQNINNIYMLSETKNFEKYTYIYNNIKEDKHINFIELNFTSILKFLEKNINNKIKILIYNISTSTKDSEKLYKIIKWLKNNNPKFIVISLIPTDWWFQLNKLNGRYSDLILFYRLNVKNFMFICGNKPEFVEKVLNTKILYKKNILYFNINHCYDNSFVEFNKNPKNIILSNGAGGITYYYRDYIKKFKGVKRITRFTDKNNIKTSYSKKISNYICNFVTTRDVLNLGKYPLLKNRKINVEKKHLISLQEPLMKHFECIASGSLLLCPLMEKPYLEKIGLIEDKNCMFVDMSNDKKIQEKIDFIIDPKNRKFIDKVRKAGQEHGRKNLNSKKKYQEFKKILSNL
jgi:hypothetical protein